MGSGRSGSQLIRLPNRMTQPATVKTDRRIDAVDKSPSDNSAILVGAPPSTPLCHRRCHVLLVNPPPSVGSGAGLRLTGRQAHGWGHGFVARARADHRVVRAGIARVRHRRDRTHEHPYATCRLNRGVCAVVGTRKPYGPTTTSLTSPGRPTTTVPHLTVRCQRTCHSAAERNASYSAGRRSAVQAAQASGLTSKLALFRKNAPRLQQRKRNSLRRGARCAPTHPFSQPRRSIRFKTPSSLTVRGRW